MPISRIDYPLQMRIDPKPSNPLRILVKKSPQMLMKFGAQMPVAISIPSAVRTDGMSVKPKIVLGCIDTGASLTSIDINLATEIGLPMTGYSEAYTASGRQKAPTFAVDLLFPTLEQRLYKNLNICSCTLPYKVDQDMSPHNIGILLGRDLLAGWIMIWDGATSSVTVSC